MCYGLGSENNVCGCISSTFRKIGLQSDTYCKDFVGTDRVEVTFIQYGSVELGELILGGNVEFSAFELHDIDDSVREFFHGQNSSVFHIVGWCRAQNNTNIEPQMLRSGMYPQVFQWRFFCNFISLLLTPHTDAGSIVSRKAFREPASTSHIDTFIIAKWVLLFYSNRAFARLWGGSMCRACMLEVRTYSQQIMVKSIIFLYFIVEIMKITKCIVRERWKTRVMFWCK